MQEYANIGSDSGILRYQIGDDYIVVEFEFGNPRFYNYTYQSTGKARIDVMKALADAGEELNTYINKEVKKDYYKRGNSLDDVL